MLSRVLLNILFANISSYVLWGIEFEARFGSRKEFSLEKPIIDRGNWILSTDGYSPVSGYILEFSTKYGYDIETIINAGKEIQRALKDILAKFDENIEQISNQSAFKELLNGYYEVNKQIKESKIYNYTEIDISNFSIKHAIEEFKQCLEIFEKYGIIKDIENEFNLTNSYIVSELQKRINNINVSRVNNKVEKLDSNKMVEILCSQDDSEYSNMYSILANYKNYIQFTYDNPFSKDGYFNDQTIENFATKIAKNNENEINDMVAHMIKYNNQIPARFQKNTLPLNAREDFEISCFYDIKEENATYKISGCKDKAKKTIPQFTFQFPISSYTKLMKHFASLVNENEIDKYRNIQNSKFNRKHAYCGTFNIIRCIL